MNQNEMDVVDVETDHQIQACYPVLLQLRPQLNEEQFLAQIRRQMEAGYCLMAVRAQGRVQAVAGYRMGENLAWGKFLYIDDLVTDEACRSHGVGHTLIQAIIEKARSNQCQQLHLDSGVQRFDAHRFYLRERMNIVGHHFMRML